MKGIFLAFVCALALTSATEVDEVELNGYGCPLDNMVKMFITHKYCDRYSVCVAGKPVVIKCPSGLVYNTELSICDWKDSIECGERIYPAPESEEEEDIDEVKTEIPLYGYDDPSQAPAICALKGSDSILISHELCDKYYQCNHGSPIVRPCPPNLYYNPKIGACDWQANVDCVLPPSEDESLTEPERACLEGSFLVPNTKYCNVFYKCGPKGPVAQFCPKGTVFDFKLQTCNWPTFVNCEDKLIKPIPVEEESEEEEEIEEEEIEEEEVEEEEDEEIEEEVEEEEDEEVEEEVEEEEEEEIEEEEEEEIEEEEIEEEEEEEVIEEDSDEVLVGEPEFQS